MGFTHTSDGWAGLYIELWHSYMHLHSHPGALWETSPPIIWMGKTQFDG